MDIPRDEGGFETRWLIGLTGGLVFVPETRTPGPLEAAKLGAEQTWDVITTSLSGLVHMVTGAISSCNLSGPITIAETSGAAASLGIASFIWFIAMLSTAVGLLNLFLSRCWTAGIWCSTPMKLCRAVRPRTARCGCSWGSG